MGREKRPLPVEIFGYTTALYSLHCASNVRHGPVYLTLFSRPRRRAGWRGTHFRTAIGAIQF